MAPPTTTSSGSSLLTPDEEAMALLQSGPLSPSSMPAAPPAAGDDCSCSCSSSASTSCTDDEHEHDKQPQLHLRVKCNGGNLQPPPPPPTAPGNGGEHHPLQISPSATVADLKASVRAVLGPGCRGRYLRLIVRGRLLAPDAAPVTNFGLEDGDVVHAVVAAAGVRGGHQARLAGGVDLSGIGGGRGSGRGSTGTSRSRRGVGIDAAGIIVNNGGSNNNDDSDSDYDNDDDDEDLEAGRQRRGFDRLRGATGLSREEIAILRLHFARQIDRFGERRERNRRRLERERELQAAAEASASASAADAADATAASTAEGGGSGGNAPSPAAPQVPAPTQTSQDIRIDRLRLEEEWMAAQGPTSEFRLNLNANAPIVLGALRNRATLGALGGTGGGFAGSLGTTAIPGGGASNPWQAGATRGASIVGTDRDFIWGFLLGFFLGNILFFWALVPSVPHKQRLGLIAGMVFHSMMRNRSDDMIVDDSYDD